MNNSYNERNMKIIDLKKTILEDNDVDADRLREELKKKNVFYMNVMSRLQLLLVQLKDLGNILI